MGVVVVGRVGLGGAVLPPPQHQPPLGPDSALSHSDQQGISLGIYLALMAREKEWEREQGWADQWTGVATLSVRFVSRTHQVPVGVECYIVRTFLSDRPTYVKTTLKELFRFDILFTMPALFVARNT